jgi:plastocyanin
MYVLDDWRQTTLEVLSMRIVTAIVVSVLGSFLLACSGPERTTTPTSPSTTAASNPSNSQSSANVSAGPATRQVGMFDACDAPSFTQAGIDCARNHGMPFPELIAQLVAHQFAGAWHFAPSQTDAKLGDALIAVNKGGEVHTFTRVASFGGGIVPELNALAGTPTIAPECSSETTFVPPGGTDTETLDQTGELKFECCIHPWMRTTVLVKSH